jgi:hypothetical protein
MTHKALNFYDVCLIIIEEVGGTSFPKIMTQNARKTMRSKEIFQFLSKNPCGFACSVFLLKDITLSAVIEKEFDCFESGWGNGNLSLITLLLWKSDNNRL